MTFRDNFKGQGAVIMFISLFVIILLVTGITLSLSQNKTSERVVYTESNLVAYYAALTGLQEAFATRFVPRSNIYAIQYALKNSTKVAQIASIAPEMVNNIGSLDSSKILPPIFPNSGFIFTAADTATIPSIDSSNIRKNLISTYIYKVIAGKTGNNENDSIIIRRGTPENIIKGRMELYSLGYTLLPNNKVDKIAIKASIDLDRTDTEDPSATDEIESFEVITDPDKVKKIETDIVRPYQSSEALTIQRVVAYHMRGLFFDLVSNEYRNWPVNSATQDIGSGITDGATVNVDTTKKTSTSPQFRIIFNRPIDERSLSNPDTFKICEKNISTNCKTFNQILFYPLSDTLILSPIDASNQLKSNTEYSIEISNILDQEGNPFNLARINFATY